MAISRLEFLAEAFLRVFDSIEIVTGAGDGLRVGLGGARVRDDGKGEVAVSEHCYQKQWEKGDASKEIDEKETHQSHDAGGMRRSR